MSDTIMVPPSRLSWSAVFGGALFAVGIWLLLHLLGLGIGLTAIDPNNPDTLRGAGIGTGIWSLIVPLIALFLGGLVAARVTTPSDRVTGAIHGAVVWALTTVFGIAFLFSALGAIMGTVAQVGGQAIGAVAETAGRAVESSGGVGDTLASLGIDADAVIAPVNQRLQQQGLPAVQPEQLEAATRDTLRTSVQQGRFDRETMISALAANTAMSRQEAEQAAMQIETQFNERFGQVGQQVQQGALAAAESTGPVLLWTFAALLLGLISAMLGSVLGIRQRERRFEQRIERERPTTIITPAEARGTVITTTPSPT